MVAYENDCVDCPQGCMDCGRKSHPVLICDECGSEESELYYAPDGKQYCNLCVLHYLEKVEVG